MNYTDHRLVGLVEHYVVSLYAVTGLWQRENKVYSPWRTLKKTFYTRSGNFTQTFGSPGLVTLIKILTVFVLTFSLKGSLWGIVGVCRTQVSIEGPSRGWVNVGLYETPIIFPSTTHLDGVPDTELSYCLWGTFYYVKRHLTSFGCCFGVPNLWGPERDHEVIFTFGVVGYNSESLSYRPWSVTTPLHSIPLPHSSFLRNFVHPVPEPIRTRLYRHPLSGRHSNLLLRVQCCRDK